MSKRIPEHHLDALAAESFPGSDAPSLGGPSATPAGPAERGDAPAERIARVLDHAHADLQVPELAQLLALVDATGRELERGRVPAERPWRWCARSSAPAAGRRRAGGASAGGCAPRRRTWRRGRAAPRWPRADPPAAAAAGRYTRLCNA